MLRPPTTGDRSLTELMQSHGITSITEAGKIYRLDGSISVASTTRLSACQRALGAQRRPSSVKTPQDYCSPDGNLGGGVEIGVGDAIGYLSQGSGSYGFQASFEGIDLGPWWISGVIGPIYEFRGGLPPLGMASKCRAEIAGAIGATYNLAKFLAANAGSMARRSQTPLSKPSESGRALRGIPASRLQPSS
jgi:hypothetical protein